MGQTLRDVIRETTDRHLNAGYTCAGQCLRAVGNVGGTLPERPDLTELPMSDVADGGLITGMALAGKRPIFVIRYQGFCWFNMSIPMNYAAKSKAIWGKPCPMLIRAISMEGGIGPVASSSHHSLVMRMPGVKIYSPMTPYEWEVAYEEFMTGDDVVYLSEHRGAWGNEKEFGDEFRGGKITLYPISITRFAAQEAVTELEREGIAVNILHIRELKPLYMRYLSTAEIGIVIDDDYASGAASAIAMEIHQLTGAKMHVMGLENRTAGFSAQTDNLPPSKSKIKDFIRSLL